MRSIQYIVRCVRLVGIIQARGRQNAAGAPSARMGAASATNIASTLRKRVAIGSDFSNSHPGRKVVRRYHKASSLCKLLCRSRPSVVEKRNVPIYCVTLRVFCTKISKERNNVHSKSNRLGTTRILPLRSTTGVDIEVRVERECLCGDTGH